MIVLLAFPKAQYTGVKLFRRDIWRLGQTADEPNDEIEKRESEEQREMERVEKRQPDTRWRIILTSLSFLSENGLDHLFSDSTASCWRN